MKRATPVILYALLFLLSPAVHSEKRFGESLCTSAEYTCITIKPGESWISLFPNPEELDVVRRVNRMNVRLRAGMIIAVPKNLERLSIYDVSPFPRYIEPDGEKTIFVSQKQLAWGAYDEQGELVWSNS